MKIVRFAVDKEINYGILDGTSIQGIENKPYLPHIKPSGQHYQLSKVRLLAPCLPSKIVTLGLNYRAQAEETNTPLPNAPLIFPKPSTAVIGPEDNIPYPPNPHRINYEGELGVVIKKPAWRVLVEEALDYILGYTCFNDITHYPPSSDVLRTQVQDSDTLAAVGPCIETELNPGNVILETYLNGEIKQHTSTSDLIYSIPELINFTSNVMPLRPGDIIATGTPSGTGPMYPGDTIEIKIKPIGTLRNYVVKNGGEANQ